jgi:hypothetical protein
MGKLEEYKSKAPDIVGSSTINHAARVKLGLTCSQYCFLDFLHRRQENPTGNQSIWINLGFGEREIEQLVRECTQRGYLIIEPETDQKLRLSSKWNDAFTSAEKEFEEFWHETVDNKRLVAWTGTKKKALEYWVKLRKKHSFDFMMKQRNDYFQFLRLQKKLRKFDQQRLMCQVFLNPANERYMENYEDYVMQLLKHYGDPEQPKIKPVTKEEILSQYGKDNHQ